jgi:hypothetical protein
MNSWLPPSPAPSAVLLLSMTTTAEETRALSQVTERMQTRFPDARADAVRFLVTYVHHQYDGRPIRDFVPVLVERAVYRSLRSQG